MSTPNRSAEFDNSRLGVIYFLGNLQVDLSPEKSVSDLKDAALGFVKSKVSNQKVIKGASALGGSLDPSTRRSTTSPTRSRTGSWTGSIFRRTTPSLGSSMFDTTWYR